MPQRHRRGRAPAPCTSSHFPALLSVYRSSTISPVLKEGDLAILPLEWFAAVSPAPPVSAGDSWCSTELLLLFHKRFVRRRGNDARNGSSLVPLSIDRLQCFGRREWISHKYDEERGRGVGAKLFEPACDTAVETNQDKEEKRRRTRCTRIRSKHEADRACRYHFLAQHMWVLRVIRQIRGQTPGIRFRQKSCKRFFFRFFNFWAACLECRE